MCKGDEDVRCFAAQTGNKEIMMHSKPIQGTDSRLTSAPICCSSLGLANQGRFALILAQTYSAELKAGVLHENCCVAEKQALRTL